MVVVETAVTPGFHVIDRAAYRLQPAANDEEGENRRECGADKGNSGKRDGDPGSRLGATLRREGQIVQKNKVAACLVGRNRKRTDNEASLV